VRRSVNVRTRRLVVPGGEHGYVTFEIPAFVECDPHAFRRRSKLARFTVNDSAAGWAKACARFRG
jgi:hypothetical protein